MTIEWTRNRRGSPTTSAEEQQQQQLDPSSSLPLQHSPPCRRRHYHHHHHQEMQQRPMQQQQQQQRRLGRNHNGNDSHEERRLLYFVEKRGEEGLDECGECCDCNSNSSNKTQTMGHYYYYSCCGYISSRKKTLCWLALVLVMSVVSVLRQTTVVLDGATTTTTSNSQNQNQPLQNEEQQQPTTFASSPLLFDWKKDPSKRYILYYTTFWKSLDFQFGQGQEPFQSYKCPVQDCIVTSDRNYFQLENVTDSLALFDAVLIHPLDDIRGKEETHFSYIATWRKPYQRFVLFYMESPAYSYDVLEHPGYRNFFNWTMTYRWDSTFPRPYGWFQPKHNNNSTNNNKTNTMSYPSIPSPWMSYNATRFVQDILPYKPAAFWSLAKRPKKVAWIVSNCKTSSRRESFVQELQQYISVDIFGKCHSLFTTTTTTRPPTKKRAGAGASTVAATTTIANTTVPPSTFATCNVPFSHEQVDNCTEVTERDYKFYLAFENAFCNDYVTEKFFLRMRNAVVITLGQANYTRLAPPHSYINVLDPRWDRNPALLAAHLNALDENDTEYLSHFWWQDYYDISPRAYTRRDRWENFAPAMCQLCERLHQSTPGADDPHEYDDINTWWRDRAEINRIHLKTLSAPLSTPELDDFEMVD